VVQDVTELRQTEAALSESHEQLANTLESITDAFIALDEEWRFTFVNPQAARLLRRTQAELIGKNMWQEFPEGVGTEFDRAYRQAIAEQMTVQIEEFYPPLDCWLELRIYPMRNGLAVYFQDVTARKAAQAQRDRLLAEAEAARQEAEASNRSKDEFVSLVAHELRSPLNAILGWATLLQTRSLNPEMTKQALETIARNTQRQVQLIEDLLDVSRIVRGTLRLEFAPVDLGNVVREAIATIQPTAVTKGLQLETQLNATSPIQGDFGRLQQVVLNLLTNAVKFTPEGGRIQVLLEQRDAQICIQVSDTGKGISSDFLPYVFERFRQDEQSTTAKQGLGLGLAIVHYIVEQHGGTITTASEGEGQGATFTVLLPLSENQEQSMGNEEAKVNPSSPPFLSSSADTPLSDVRVLLVDDNLDMLDLTALILEQAGAVVETTLNAATALQQFSAFRPDILISDIAMPEQDGYELLQQLRSRYPDSQIPAIALTAYASEAYREDSLRVGFVEHLTKPVEPDVLIAAIIRFLREAGNRYV
jgi:PAS domain S-box-containing protein